jgi:hypothetical protein
VSTTEELRGRKSIGSGLDNREYGTKDPSPWPRGIFYQQKDGINFAYKLNRVALIHEGTLRIERSQLVGAVSANFLRIRGCHMANPTDPLGRILGFLDRSRYLFFQVHLHL